MQQITDKIVKDTISILQSDIDNWKKQLIQIQQVITYQEGQSQNLLNQLRTMALNSDKYEGSRERDIGYFILKQRNQKVEENMVNKYEELLKVLEKNYKEAYRTIHKIRDYFYEPITYRFGFTLDGEEYYEASLDIDDILKLTTLQMQSRTVQFDKLYGLRLQINRSILQDIKNSKNIEKIDNQHRNLLKAIFEAKTRKVVNMGQRFETYVALKEKKAESYTKKSISKALSESRKNNLSWTRGGDVGSEQVKFMDASLTSSNTLIQTINKLIEILNHVNKDSNYLKTEIIKLFGPNTKFNNYVEEKASEELKRAFHKELKNMPDIKILDK